jgi:hypothetical protein
MTAPTAGVEERELVRRMQVELLHLITSAGHLALVNDREHLGRCNMVLPKHGRCSPLCSTLRAVMNDADAYLRAHPEMPAQPSLWAETEAAG